MLFEFETSAECTLAQLDDSNILLQFRYKARLVAYVFFFK